MNSKERAGSSPAAGGKAGGECNNAENDKKLKSLRKVKLCGHAILSLRSIS